MEGSNVLVLAECSAEGRPTGFTMELVGLGAHLASKLESGLRAAVLGDGVEGAAAELASHGVEEVLLADHPSLGRYDPETHSGVLKELLRRSEAHTVLAGSTPLGSDLLPRLSFAVGAGLVTDCVGVEVDESGEGVVFTRPVFGGNALALVKARTGMRMATVRRRVGWKPEESEREGEVVGCETEPPASRLRLGRKVEESRGTTLEGAPAVVSGGRGIGSEEGFEDLRRLADILGGAVGATRPACDSGWIPSTCQVGITGKIVAPEIYVAVGLSGSTQHLTGMSDSGKVVAINRDPDAYIFKVSDYGVVGDWKRVLPAFISAVEERLRGEG